MVGIGVLKGIGKKVGTEIEIMEDLQVLVINNKVKEYVA